MTCNVQAFCYHIYSISVAYSNAAYSWTRGPNLANPVSAPLKDFQKDLTINTVSAYAAAQAAVASFSKLPHDAKKTFIYTGNNGNTLVGLEDIFPKSWNVLAFLDHA
jgi:hypothetical protein